MFRCWRFSVDQLCCFESKDHGRFNANILSISHDDVSSRNSVVRFWRLLLFGEIAWNLDSGVSFVSEKSSGLAVEVGWLFFLARGASLILILSVRCERHGPMFNIVEKCLTTRVVKELLEIYSLLPFLRMLVLHLELKIMLMMMQNHYQLYYFSTTFSTAQIHLELGTVQWQWEVVQIRVHNH